MTYSTKHAALGSRVRVLVSDRQSCNGLTYADLDSVKRYNHVLAKLVENRFHSWLHLEVVVFQVSVWRG